MRLLDLFPKPLLDDIVCNRCLPVVGAGFSLNAELPPGKTMPVWDGLSDKLAQELSDYPKSSPIDLISAYVHEFTRSKLIERLHDLLLVDSARPGNTHVSFCDCQFDIVVTTNFDFLLERGFEKVQKYCQPIIEEDQLPIGKKQPHVTLLKLHGDLHHPSRLVVTEDDYDLFLDRYPLLSTYLANLLILRTPLLIGYSLDDPDFRHIWQLVGDRLGHLRRPAYVLSVGAKPSDIARYERRGVKVINLPGSKERYAETLQQLFTQLRDYWAKELFSVSTVVDDKPLADLSIPSDATNTLCFFSVPSELLSFYRTSVFPLATRHGLTPITVDDVNSPGDSQQAKTTALLSKADIVLVETQDKRSLYELHNVPKRAKILLVTDDDSLVSEGTHPWPIMQRPKNFWDSEEFVTQIDRWFARISEQLRPELQEEPLRLLRKREYRSAVISAVSLLDHHLRQLVEKDTYTYKLTSRGSMPGIEALLNQDLIDERTAGNLRNWMVLRNKALHQGEEIPPKVANNVVNGIMNVVGILQNSIQETAVTKF